MDHEYKAVQVCCRPYISEFLILYDVWPRITLSEAVIGGVGDKEMTSKRELCQQSLQLCYGLHQSQVSSLRL